ncbi:MAG TPA: endonuclease V [bacterium]
MNLPPPLHPWDLAPSEAVALQRALAGRVHLTWDGRAVERVAGVDVAFDRQEQRLFAGVVVLSYPSLTVVEEVGVEAPVTFPYVPGLLSFREVPPVLACFERLEAVPDLVVCDGQGTAHPRRVGLACHLGLWLGVPAIGCAKSRLIGRYREPGLRRGCATRLYHPDGDEIGRCLRTRDGVRPVYCSPGHRIDGVTTMRWVLRLCRGYRLPETTRAAHQFVTRLRRGEARPAATLR